METNERNLNSRTSSLRGTIVESLLREAVSIVLEEMELHKSRGKPKISALEDVKEPKEPGARLIPLRQWNKFHPAPPVSGLRHLAFNAKTNGFDRCIRRIGRSVYILEAEFFKWVEGVNGGRGR